MKKFFTIFLAAILAVSMVGCGSSSKNDDPSIKYSSDYYGLETGFQLIYSVIETENGTTTNHILTRLVTGETTTGSEIYKVTLAYEDETLGYEGDYIQKIGAEYYEYGDWEGTNEYRYTSDNLILRNPVTKSFKSPWLGTVMGQETVSVPAGTFNAWLFQDVSEGSSSEWGTYTKVWKEWFVPNIGFVKSTITTTRKSDGVTLSTLTEELKSSVTGVTINTNSIKSSQVATQSIITGNIHPKLFHSKH